MELRTTSRVATPPGRRPEWPPSVELVRGERWATDGVREVAVTLRNPSAQRATSEVVQVYLHDPVAEVVRPVVALIAFARVDLGPGERRRARLRLHADLTSFTGRSGERIVEPGDVELRVGGSCADVRGRLALRLTGARRVVGFARRRTPDVIIESPR